MEVESRQSVSAAASAVRSPAHEICKISVSIRGHRTSFSVERAFFEELSKLAATSGISLARLVSSIDQARHPEQNLSSAIRLHVLNAIKNGAVLPGAA